MEYIHLILVQWHIWPVLIFLKNALWVGFMLYIAFLPFYLIDKAREVVIVGFQGIRNAVVNTGRRADRYLRK